VFFDFRALPLSYFGFLAPIALGYVVIVECAKRWFYRSVPQLQIASRAGTTPS